MSFHEKSLWASLIAVSLVYGGYFISIIPNLLEREHYPVAAAWPAMIGLTIFIVVVQIVLQLTAAVVSPGTVNDPEDERDKMIDLKAGRYSGVILGAGMLLTIFGIMTGYSGYVLIHFGLFAVVVAELMKLGRQVYFYQAGL